MTDGISIIVPVGPDPAYLQYLKDCLGSITYQMATNDQIVLIDDMAYLGPASFIQKRFLKQVRYISNPWLLGCAASWNIGVAYAANEWCILMGSDDLLLPGCLDACRRVIADPKHDKAGFYNLTCQLDNGEVTDLHNNAAMVSKTLWYRTGGFPPSAGIGAPDALLISIMMVHMSDHLHQIEKGKPYYWVRSGPHQDTRKQAGPFWEEVISIRNKETERWKPPRWRHSDDG